MQYRQSLLSLAVITIGALAAGPSALADTMYQVTVNTTSQTGNYGYIDFQLNPSGGGSQAVDAQVLNFMSDGVLNPADPLDGTIGEATGVLPGTIMLINSESTNEYTEGMTFGTTATFELDLYGPAISMPNGQGGGSFYLDFFDTNGNPLLTTSSTGYALELDILGSGSVSVAYQSPDVTLSTPVATPEPSSLALLSGGLAILGLFRGRQRVSELFRSAR